MRVDRQVRKPAGCWYRNTLPNHEQLVVPVYGVIKPQISDSDSDMFFPSANMYREQKPLEMDTSGWTSAIRLCGKPLV